MHKRRSHNKSRKGCTNCKRRHVKCDEQGPPCAACVARDTTDTCIYQSKRGSPTNDGTPSSTDLESCSRSDGQEIEESEPRRLLELKLMHRFMTHTWKSLHGMDEDEAFLLEQMPQACLKYDYLLYATMALCATDLAIHGDEKTLQPCSTKFYLATALSYYDLASQALRPQLDKLDPNAQVWLYMASVLLTMIQMALPQCLELHSDEPQPSMMERTLLIIDLFMGSGKVALADYLSLASGMGDTMVNRAVELLGGPPPENIDLTLRSVMESIRAVIQDPTIPDSEAAAPQYHDAYVRVARILLISLVEESRGLIKGTCVGVPMYCGRDFSMAINQSQPTALFLLIIFGALVERGARDGFWWAKYIGPGLVQEACDILARTQPILLQTPHWQDAIAWARTEVGLPLMIY